MGNETIKFIYGAGKYGKLLLHCFKDFMKIDYFVQTEQPTVDTIEGIAVIPFEKMVNMEGKKIVFIAMRDRTISKEIEKNICNADNLNILVYDCGTFIEDNLLWKSDPYSTGDQHCILCGKSVKEFLPAGIKAEIFNKHHIIGGGYRDNCICPWCGLADRDRWIYYVLKYKTDIFEMSGKVLHFAPERGVTDYIKQNKELDYYTGDIVLGRAMHMTDITDIQYRDNMFDYVISNHVLEHIVDEKKAVSEIKRVLKTNGKWIFSFPICMDMPTYEDSAIVSPEARLKAYGQEDHVRLYGIDYKARFESYGLALQIFSPENEFDTAGIHKYGFIKDDVIIVATKLNDK